MGVSPVCRRESKENQKQKNELGDQDRVGWETQEYNP